MFEVIDIQTGKCVAQLLGGETWWCNRYGEYGLLGPGKKPAMLSYNPRYQTPGIGRTVPLAKGDGITAPYELAT